MVLAQARGITFWEVVRSSGVRALYHGALATLYRDIVFNASLFTVRQIVMQKYEEKTGAEPGPYMKVWYGLPASMLAGVVACPFDVVKTRIQAEKHHGMHNAQMKEGIILYTYCYNNYYDKLM